MRTKGVLGVFADAVGKGTKNFGIFETFWVKISNLDGDCLNNCSYCYWFRLATPAICRQYRNLGK